jgi:hypothetical protein
MRFGGKKHNLLGVCGQRPQGDFYSWWRTKFMKTPVQVLWLRLAALRLGVFAPLR